MKRMSAVVLAVPLLIACGSSDRNHTPVVGGCGSTSLHRGAVPTWTAHSNPPTYLPFAVGSRGMAAAFIFGYPLRAGNPVNPTNKILWIVRLPGTGLVVRATPLGTTAPVVRVKLDDSAGPEIYPSYVNVPQSGCWHLTLHWARYTDSLDLMYRR